MLVPRLFFAASFANRRLHRLWTTTNLPSCSINDAFGFCTRNYNSIAGGNGSENGAADQPSEDPDPMDGQITVYAESPLIQIKIPDSLPDVPIVTVNRYPSFPGSVRKIDLIKNKELMKLILSKCDRKMPYIGVFVKRNNEDKSEGVASISQLYTVGAFAHILEKRDHEGKVLEMVTQSHRRIRILHALEPPQPQPPAPNGSGRWANSRAAIGGKRRAGTGSRENGAATAVVDPMEGGGAEKDGSQAADGDQQPPEKLIIYARTENVITEPIEITRDIRLKIESIIGLIKDIMKNSNFMQQIIALHLTPDLSITTSPEMLCDFVGRISQNADTEELQALMEETNVARRMDLAMELLQKELDNVKTLKQIRESVEKKVSEQQRKYILQEQLKAIKRELGIEKEDKQAVIEKLDERLKDLNVPEYAMKVIKEEQTKLSFLDPHSSEFSISKNYLDWLVSLPWGKTSEEIKDVHRAREVLDEDHYGMKDVKERILEFIAVGILKQRTNGKILCFHGPPGVGKTSIARSIARALNREYFRFSVGGMTDVAEIKGHRRTYVGAMPGKLIQCLKKVQTENPLVLIDEVDKIGGASYHGDPASALLEVLDPEQNNNFMDHFIDVPVDLSKVLFICTANVIDRIPGPLKDRMELIEVSGYVAEEKMEIAKKFLLPKCRDKCALPEEKLVVEDEAIDTLIKAYCRESGVRNLEKHLEKIFRKAAFRLVSEDIASEQQPIVVNSGNLKDFVGREKFTNERMYETTPPGVIMGLAWTAMGGSALYIEASLARKLRPFVGQPIASGTQTQQAITGGENVVSGQQQQQHPPPGSLEATGHLGDVMKESMRTAYTVAKNVLARVDPTNDFLEQAHIHVHVPEGAVPKDGPSAGCTIASALLSLALGQPALQEVAMTGEISLTGKVLPVGGIKEKIIAAKRAGVSRVILPEENRKDFDDLADFIRRDVDAHFVAHYDQVFGLLFPDFKPKEEKTS